MGREQVLQKWLGEPDLAQTHWEQQQVWEMTDALDGYVKVDICC